MNYSQVYVKAHQKAKMDMDMDRDTDRSALAVRSERPEQSLDAAMHGSRRPFSRMLENKEYG